MTQVFHHESLSSKSNQCVRDLWWITWLWSGVFFFRSASSIPRRYHSTSVIYSYFIHLPSTNLWLVNESVLKYKVRHKVVVLVHLMKAFGESRDIAALIATLGTRFMWLITFAPRAALFDVVCFGGGAYQHCSHEGLLYSHPNGVLSFTSRGAAHQVAWETSASEGRN
jgi:hypothetical protein